jgi:hypothetical protein
VFVFNSAPAGEWQTLVFKSRAAIAQFRLSRTRAVLRRRQAITVGGNIRSLEWIDDELTRSTAP